MVPLRIQDAAHDEVLRVRERERRGFRQDGDGERSVAEGVQNPGGAVQAVDQRFRDAHEPRGQHEIPVAVVVPRAAAFVEGVPETRGKLRDELVGLFGGGFQPIGIGQRFRGHVESGLFGGGGSRTPRPGQHEVGRGRVFRGCTKNQRRDG